MPSPPQHTRTEYEDEEGFENRRHLLRLWLTSTVNTHAIDPQRASRCLLAPWQCCWLRLPPAGQCADRLYEALCTSLHSTPSVPRLCPAYCAAGFPKEAYLGIYAKGLLSAPLDAE